MILNLITSNKNNSVKEFPGCRAYAFRFSDDTLELSCGLEGGTMFADAPENYFRKKIFGNTINEASYFSWIYHVHRGKNLAL